MLKVIENLRNKFLAIEIPFENQVELNRSTVAETFIPLAPPNEQKRIADKLDGLLDHVDACREQLERVPQLLKRFRQSVLAAATTGKLIR